jgi:hypothetical protein
MEIPNKHFADRKLSLIKHGQYSFIYTIRDEKITFKTNLRQTNWRMSNQINVTAVQQHGVCSVLRSEVPKPVNIKVTFLLE